MNNLTNKPAPYTLEAISAQKEVLLQQIRAQKEVISKLTQEIVTPLAPPVNKAGALMRAVNNGMALFDGLMFGIKIMRRFRRFF